MGKLATPCLLPFTRKGLPPALIHDDLKQLDVQAVVVGAGDALEHRRYMQEVGGLRAALGHSSSMFLFLSQRDCRPFVPALPAGDSYLSLPSSSGNVRVSVQEWIDLAAAAAPDVVFMLSDEISSVSTGGGSRSRKSIDRSCQWFTQQLADLRSRPSLKHTAIFAAVQGGNSAPNRARACSSVSALKVDGVLLGGLNTGEEREERCDIIRASVRALPPHLPRMLSSTAGPEDMLDAIALGVDFMDSNYSSTLAEEGLAATFPVTFSQFQRASPATRTVDIKDPSFALDSAPLLQGCSCSACCRHSRSYLHHLWNTHEMLAEVLLAVHNLHHCRLLLLNARSAVAAGTFSEFVSAFMATACIDVKPCLE